MNTKERNVSEIGSVTILQVPKRCVFFRIPNDGRNPKTQWSQWLYIIIIIIRWKSEVVPVLNWLSICHDDLWRNGGIAPPYLTSVLDWREWSVSRSSRFNLGKRVPGIHWIGGWVEPRAGLDDMEKRKIFHWRESNLGRPAHSPSLYRTQLTEPFIIWFFIYILFVDAGPGEIKEFLLRHWSRRHYSHIGYVGTVARIQSFD
jgi:hypothetical protein